MTQTEIRQAAERCYLENKLWHVPTKPHSLVYGEGAEYGAKTALTHGWNSPDVVPEIPYDRDFINVLMISYVGSFYISGRYDAEFRDDEGEIRNVLAWRYDNAQDIYELLKQNGTI